MTGNKAIFFDTAPFIYFIEGNEQSIQCLLMTGKIKLSFDISKYAFNFILIAR